MTAPAEILLQARFLASMAHELRAPLNAIIGYAEILAGGLAPDVRRQEEYAAQIAGNARQLLHQISSLVELAQADAGLLKLTRQPVDLASLVADALRMVAPAAVRRGVEILADLEGAPALVSLDATRIMQALHGLLSGAIALAARGHKMRLRLMAEGDTHIRLELAGLTIGPGDTGELIVPTPAAWLGLSLARSIVEAHGGEVGIARTTDKRTILHAVLPGVAPPSE
jgi:signal transduction histidine kinase